MDPLGTLVQLRVAVLKYVQQGASSAATQAVGGFTEGGGGLSTGSGGGGSQLDPVMTLDYGWAHRTSPQSNSVTTGRTAIAYNSSGINYGISKNFTTGTGVGLS